MWLRFVLSSWLLQHPEMLQCVPDPVLVHRIGDVVRRLLCLAAGVAHGHGGAHGPEHIHIVVPVTEGHGLGFVDAVVLKHFGDARGLAAGGGDQVCAAQSPAGEPDAGHGRKFPLVFLRHIEDRLIDGVGVAAVQVAQRGHVRVDGGLYFFHKVVVKVDVHPILLHQDAGVGILLQEAQQYGDVGGIDGTVADDALFVAAVLPVQGHDAVEPEPFQGLHPLQHGDMPPGGEEGQDPLLPQRLQRPAGRVGDGVGFMGEERSVDVEKYGLDHGEPPGSFG